MPDTDAPAPVQTTEHAVDLATILEGDDIVVYTDSLYGNSSYANALAARFGAGQTEIPDAGTGEWNQTEFATETIIILTNGSFPTLNSTTLHPSLQKDTIRWYVVDAGTLEHGPTVVDVRAFVNMELTRIYSLDTRMCN